MSIGGADGGDYVDSKIFLARANRFEPRVGAYVTIAPRIRPRRRVHVTDKPCSVVGYSLMKMDFGSDEFDLS